MMTDDERKVYIAYRYYRETKLTIIDGLFSSYDTAIEYINEQEKSLGDAMQYVVFHLIIMKIDDIDFGRIIHF